MQDQVFVERGRQLEKLQGYLDGALAGRAQICFVVGQAGSGKTALVREFVERALAGDPELIVATGSCNAQTGVGDPYLPFREALAMLTGDASSDGRTKELTRENANRLRTVLVRSVQVLVEVAPDLVGLFVPGASLAGALGKALANKTGWMDKLEGLTQRGAKVKVEQSRIFEQYAAFVRQLSARTPLILFLDDLQWADGASIALLFHLARELESSQVLIVGAYRPDDVALGRDGGRHPLEPVVNELTRYYGDIRIDLDEVTEAENRRFVAALLDAEPNCLGESFEQALYRHTSGHALFTVELLQAMKERGDLIQDDSGCWVEGGVLDWDLLPARVEGVIEERIDRLEEDLREILTVGSVEGEQFSAEVVARVEALAERKVVRQLSQELERRYRLVNAQGVVQLDRRGRDVRRLSLYRFVHALFQQYIYGNLSEAERVYLHHDIGEAVETLFAGRTEEVAAQLARHFEEAGVADKAAAYRLQAGEKALRISAHLEAEGHLRRGLALLADLDPDPERMRLELALQSSLGTTLVATRGYASPEVEEAFARARELGLALKDPALALQAMYGLGMYHKVRGQLEQAYAEGQELLALAEEAGETGYWLGGQLELGAAATHRGELSQAPQHLRQLLARYDRDRHRELGHRLSQDPAVGAHSFRAWDLWLQGCPEQAIAAKDAALDLAEELDQPYTLGYAVSFAAMLYKMLRQLPECEREAAKAFEIGQRGSFPSWQAIGMLCRAWVMAHQGREEGGIAEAEAGIELWTSIGARLLLPFQHTLLAEAYLAAGRREGGLEQIEASFRYPEERWWLPEQHRVRAELLLLAPGFETEAEASLRQALDVSRAQGSKALELRAATSLARLLQQRGSDAEGQVLLAGAYSQFTEGLNMPDLREARELLAQLEDA